MSKHDHVVMERYLEAKAKADNPDAMYDLALKEYSYHLNDFQPFGDHPTPKGREKGDIDVGLVDIENQVLYVEEIKTNYNELSKADEQLERVDDHFSSTGWTVIKRKILEPDPTNF